MTKEPHIEVYKDDRFVYIKVDGREVKIRPEVAAALGESLFKTSCDVLAART